MQSGRVPASFGRLSLGEAQRGRRKACPAVATPRKALVLYRTFQFFVFRAQAEVVRHFALVRNLPLSRRFRAKTLSRSGVLQLHMLVLLFVP